MIGNFLKKLGGITGNTLGVLGKKYSSGSGRSPIFRLDAYGKLPFYNDYIAIITSPSALQWQSWLLDNFGRVEMRIPPGRWPFIFQMSQKSEPVAGIIEDSSDGIREFPFSLFTACGKAVQNFHIQRDMLIGLWQRIHGYREELVLVENINDCYGVVRGKTFQIAPTAKSLEGYGIHEEGDWPRLHLSKGIGLPELYLVVEGGTTPEQFIGNWREVAAYSADQAAVPDTPINEIWSPPDKGVVSGSFTKNSNEDTQELAPAADAAPGSETINII